MHDRPAVCAMTLLLSLPFCACSTAPVGSPGRAQTIVETFARENAGISRLTVHAMGEAETISVLASTDGTKIGKPSDQEDLLAMQTGKPVVLEEVGACDVTVPVLNQGGKWTHAVGITLKAAPGADRKPLIAKAVEIAGAIAAALGDE